MPCSGLKSATSCTPGALCSRSIVAAPSRGAAGVIGDEADALALEQLLKPSRASTSMPGQHRRPTAVRGGRRGDRSQPAGPRGAHAADAKRRRGLGRERPRRPAPPRRPSRCGCAAAPTSPVPSGCRRLERKITYEFDAGSIHKRRAGEAGVAERADRKQIAAIGRERRVDVPAEAANARSCPAASAAMVIARDASAADSTARRAEAPVAEQHAREARQIARRAEQARRDRRRRPCAAPSDRARRRAAAPRRALARPRVLVGAALGRRDARQQRLRPAGSRCRSCRAARTRAPSDTHRATAR